MNFDNSPNEITDLPIEILAAIVGFIPARDVKKFALLSLQTLSAVMTVYQSKTLDVKEPLYTYLCALSTSFCYECNVIHTDSGYLFNKPHNKCKTCFDCDIHRHADLIHDFVYEKYDNHDQYIPTFTVSRCRFGCNWCCVYCGSIWQDLSEVKVDNEGNVCCYYCIDKCNLKTNYINSLTLCFDERGNYHYDKLQQEDDLSSYYFDPDCHIDLIARLDSGLLERVVIGCHMVRDYKIVLYSDHETVLRGIDQAQLNILESIAGLFGDN
jgi:hypothetical protein